MRKLFSILLAIVVVFIIVIGLLVRQPILDDAEHKRVKKLALDLGQELKNDSRFSHLDQFGHVVGGVPSKRTGYILCYGEVNTTNDLKALSQWLERFSAAHNIQIQSDVVLAVPAITNGATNKP